MQTITVAHSPDADDAFMFYALAAECIDTGDLRFTHTLQDIESLNQWAVEGRYDLTALSFHAYAHVADRYALLNCGASFGEGYGPKIITRQPLDRAQLAATTVAIPGRWTTAALLTQLYLPGVRTVELHFEEVMPAVIRGEVDAGVIIHEGQLTYQEHGLVQHMDMGVWWERETGLPLPLGGNGVRKDLPRDVQHQVADCLRRGIDYSLAHREDALAYALGFGRGLDPDRADTFVGMYVNETTRDMGARGRAAVRELLNRAFNAGVIPVRIEPEFID
jgi:1,4-dihydroxy-6-naphthoate synthase